MVRYAMAMGEFLNTPESLTPESLRSFYESPNYNMGDYVVPHGGSDIIVLFKARSNVGFTAQPGVHYKMGTKIAQAYPVA